MQYRTDPRSGNQLSALGLGCMRFPRNVGGIDLAKTEELIVRAVDSGVNYFDTAYIYFGSETALGPILERNNLREKIYLATKLPVMRCKKYEDFDRFFGEQLRRLKTDYIDYYLMHNLGGLDTWKEYCALGIEDWLFKKKALGEVRQLGFSFHGAEADFDGLLDACDWDFCQIQYNYVNTHYQAGVAGLKKAHARGLPVIVMEPLLGGKLADGLPEGARQTFESANTELYSPEDTPSPQKISLSPAGWALRWLWDQPEVTVVLSGMSDLSQLDDNIKTAELSPPLALNEKERAVYDRVLEQFNECFKIPCTGCGYCMPCPHGINIPNCFTAYNISYTSGRFTGFKQYWQSVGAFNSKTPRQAGLCESCGHCDKHCPQHIPVMAGLKDVKKRLEPWYIRMLLPLVNAYLKGKKSNI